MNKADQILDDQAVCPKCGKAFHCSTSNKCWCYEYNVPIDVMEKLQQEYDGCLCPDCLSKISEGLNH